ncbi:MAG: hypothetical protein QOE82_2168 [Thermoanaerobaculia bacterium]|jgi:hypothetical protein|nr:hypothetical protein [Thermoanaerobaculia bacterium]
MKTRSIYTLFVALLLTGLANSVFGITVNINSAETQCAVSVAGTVSSTPKLPATAVTIDFVPPSGAHVRLVTNLQLGPNGSYRWSGPVNGYPKIPAGSSVTVTTNRQVSASKPLPACN